MRTIWPVMLQLLFLAHYRGDENQEEKPAFNEKELGLWSRLVYRILKYVPDGLWKDLKPHDNNIFAGLKSGLKYLHPFTNNSEAYQIRRRLTTNLPETILASSFEKYRKTAIKR